MTDRPAYALWLLTKPHLWEIWSYNAAVYPCCLTLIRGLPWEDCQ